MIRMDFQAAFGCAKWQPETRLLFSGCLNATIGRFTEREYAVDACLFDCFGEAGEIGAALGIGKRFDEHGGVEPCNHAGLLRND